MFILVLPNSQNSSSLSHTARELVQLNSVWDFVRLTTELPAPALPFSSSPPSLLWARPPVTICRAESKKVQDEKRPSKSKHGVHEYELKTKTRYFDEEDREYFSYGLRTSFALVDHGDRGRRHRSFTYILMPT